MGGMYHFDVMVSQRILYLNGRGIQSLNQELRIGRGKKNKLKQLGLNWPIRLKSSLSNRDLHKPLRDDITSDL